MLLELIQKIPDRCDVKSGINIENAQMVLYFFAGYTSVLVVFQVTPGTVASSNASLRDNLQQVLIQQLSQSAVASSSAISGVSSSISSKKEKKGEKMASVKSSNAVMMKPRASSSPTAASQSLASVESGSARGRK